MTWIKFCGITSYEDARLALDLGVEALGFNFYSKSPRYIGPGAAQAVIRRLPKTAAIVGIFVDTPAEQIETIARSAPLDTLQFHGGTEPPAGLLTAEWRAILAIPVTDGDSEADRYAALLDRVKRIEQTYRSKIEHLLFDYRAGTGQFGGTGQQISPEILKRLAADGVLKNGIISGGLNSENCAGIVSAFRPFGVDVSSGIESAPGKKDPEKMRRFAAAVRAAA